MFNAKGYIESQRIKQKWISKVDLNIWNKYTDIFEDKSKFYDFTIKHKIIEQYDDSKHTPKYDVTGICECGKHTEFVNIRKGYKKYCSRQCAGRLSSNPARVKQTKLERYGSENYNNTEKQEATMYKKYGVRSYIQLEHVRRDITLKQRKTNESSGRWVKLEHKSDYEIYKINVQNLTRSVYKELDNSELRGNHAFNPDAYHIDHIFPIIEGFKNNIPPYIIGHISNLQMIHCTANMKKGKFITENSLCELYQRWSNSLV